MTYTKEIDGKQVFSTCRTIMLADGVVVSNPTEEMILAVGWVPYTPVINEPSEDERLTAEYQDMLAASQDKMLALMEEYFAANGTGELQQLAAERKQTRYNLDQIGKVIQTLEGDGSLSDPFKGWKVGMSVENGKWYYTESGYLWEAIKSGTPTSETDGEYFDVVGV